MFRCLCNEKGLAEKSARPFIRHGAEDWTRTSTRLPAQEPESCVSTNSTTSAFEKKIYTTIHHDLQYKKTADSLLYNLFQDGVS